MSESGGFKYDLMSTRTLLTFATLLVLALNDAAARGNELRFGQDGKFKILQLTDMHLCIGSSEYKEGQAEKTFARLSKAVHKEKPDLLIFTGDIVTEGTASRSWGRLLDSLAAYRIPFCVTFGNHDPERELTREEMSRLIAGSPYSLNVLNKKNELDDLELEILGREGKKADMVIYCLDSHDYSTIEGLGVYGWFTSEQVQQMRESCLRRTKRNGGRPVNSLAFFHICLQEFSSSWADTLNTRIGVRKENECPGALNTGMFAAMLETGNIMGVFVGHDHDNDYIVAKQGIALGYGRFSGDDTIYHNIPSGVRVIELEEGKRGFVSWILEDDGRITDPMTFTDGKVVPL
jgi:predicted phosphodiesterase